MHQQFLLSFTRGGGKNEGKVIKGRNEERRQKEREREREKGKWNIGQGKASETKLCGKKGRRKIECEFA